MADEAQVVQGEMPANTPAPEMGDGAVPDAAALKAELESARKALAAANREAADRRKKLLLSVDGQSHGWLQSGDCLEIRQAPESACFAHLPGYSWFQLLSQKLHWRGSSADPK